MALTRDRPDWTASQLNSLWDELVGVLRNAVPRQSQNEVAGWTLTEDTDETVSIFVPEDLRRIAIRRLVDGEIAVPVLSKRSDGASRLHIAAWGTPGFIFDAALGGLQILGWVDLETEPYTFTAGPWTDGLEDPGGEAIVSFQTDVQDLLDVLPERGAAEFYAAALSYTASGSGSTKKLTATQNGAFPTVDGYTPVLNDRFLYDGSNADSGLYQITVLGDESTAWQATRTTDYNKSEQVFKGTRIYVKNGSTNGDATWVNDTTGNIVLDTTSLSFKRDGLLGEPFDVVTHTQAATLDGGSLGKLHLMDRSGEAFTLTLPAANTAQNRSIWFKGDAGSATITIDANGQEQIDGSASITVNSNWFRARLFSNGTKWFILA